MRSEKDGFIELQVLVPEDAAAAFIPRVLALIRKHGCAIALTTLKAFRAQTQSSALHRDGFSFTIDIGNDAAVAAHAGRIRLRSTASFGRRPRS
jgi:hypothetical protein